MIYMAHENEGTARLVKGIRNQAGKVFTVQAQLNLLGTMTNNGIYIDSIEDEIPRGDFLFLQTGEVLNSGDRVACIPVGDYYVVLGKVT